MCAPETDSVQACRIGCISDADVAGVFFVKPGITVFCQIEAGIHPVALQSAQLAVVFVNANQRELNFDAAAFAKAAQGSACFLSEGLIALRGIDIGEAQLEFAVRIFQFYRVTVKHAADKIAFLRMAQGARQQQQAGNQDS